MVDRLSPRVLVYDASLEEKAQKVLPELQWTSEKTMGMEGLLLAIADGELDATLVDENLKRAEKDFNRSRELMTQNLESQAVFDDKQAAFHV